MESNSNLNKGKKEASSTEEKTVMYGYNGDPEDPEETETILSTNPSKSATKRYKGVWRRSGRWVARTRDPLTNSRVFLGEFYSSKAALRAYFSKKLELESKVKAAKVSNLVMIDSHGFLLGEFSRLDDDLRICD